MSQRRQARDWAPHIQDQIRRQTEAKKGQHYTKKAKEKRARVRQQIEARLEEGTPATDTRPLRIWLPGLKLHSENTILYGDKPRGIPAHLCQSHAKHNIRAAFSGYLLEHRGTLYHFPGQVDIRVMQHYAGTATTDNGNLWHKPLIDGLKIPVPRILPNGKAMVETWHLRVIKDDAPRYVRLVTVGSVPDQRETGVEILITPVE